MIEVRWIVNTVKNLRLVKEIKDFNYGIIMKKIPGWEKKVYTRHLHEERIEYNVVCGKISKGIKL